MKGSAIVPNHVDGNIKLTSTSGLGDPMGTSVTSDGNRCKDWEETMVGDRQSREWGR